MATTVAHGLIGIVFYCAARRITVGNRKLPLSVGAFLLAAVVANIPDIDMLISLLIYGDHRILHGGITHTLFFAFAGGVMVWLFAYKSIYRAVLSIAVAMVLSSHVLVDFFTGPAIGLNHSHGAMLLWPFDGARLVSQITIFRGVEHANILPGALATAAWELVLLLPITVIAIHRSHKYDHREKN